MIAASDSRDRFGCELAPLALFVHWLPATLGYLGLMSVLAVNGPAKSIFSQEMVAPRWRTTTSAIATIGLELGWSGAAAVGGYLSAQAGFRSLFFVGSMLAFAAALLLIYGSAHATRMRLSTAVLE